MKMWVALFSMVLLVPVLSMAQQPDSASLRRRVEALATEIQNDQAVGLDIVEIPAEVLTRSRVTPEVIERAFHFRLTIADIRTWKDRPALLTALKTLSVEPTAGAPDLRWGLIFSDINKKRMEAIYFDGTGVTGMLGSDTVTFKGDFFRWVTEKFLPEFR